MWLDVTLPGARSPHLSWAVSASLGAAAFSRPELENRVPDELCVSESCSNSQIPICQRQPCPASACLSLVTRELEVLSALCTLQSGAASAERRC